MIIGVNLHWCHIITKNNSLQTQARQYFPDVNPLVFKFIKISLCITDVVVFFTNLWVYL